MTAIARTTPRPRRGHRHDSRLRRWLRAWSDRPCLPNDLHVHADRTLRSRSEQVSRLPARSRGRGPWRLFGMNADLRAGSTRVAFVAAATAGYDGARAGSGRGRLANQPGSSGDRFGDPAANASTPRDPGSALFTGPRKSYSLGAKLDVSLRATAIASHEF